jgi:hypothetical protein
MFHKKSESKIVEQGSIFARASKNFDQEEEPSEHMGSLSSRHSSQFYEI